MEFTFETPTALEVIILKCFFLPDCLYVALVCQWQIRSGILTVTSYELHLRRLVFFFCCYFVDSHPKSFLGHKLPLAQKPSGQHARVYGSLLLHALLTCTDEELV